MIEYFEHPETTVIFTFDDTYLQAGSDRPTLSLSFKAADGGLVEQTRPTRVRLPPFFSNLLPEAHLREYLAIRGGVQPDREFFLIGLLGGICRGRSNSARPTISIPRALNDRAPRPRR